MKTLLILLYLILITIFSYAQNQSLGEQLVIPPKFNVPDNISNIQKCATFNEFLNKYLVYPELSVSCKNQGTELIRFTINESGMISHFKIINSVCKEIDKEVIKVLKMTNGMWTPAIVNGKPVSMEKEISVIFSIDPANDFVSMAKRYLKKGNKLLFVKKDHKKALKYFDAGVKLLPNNETLLAVRGLCKYEMGNKTGANRDWLRLGEITQIKGNDSGAIELDQNIISMCGYPEMLKTISK